MAGKDACPTSSALNGETPAPGLPRRDVAGDLPSRVTQTQRCVFYLRAFSRTVKASIS